MQLWLLLYLEWRQICNGLVDLFDHGSEGVIQLSCDCLAILKLELGVKGWRQR